LIFIVSFLAVTIKAAKGIIETKHAISLFEVTRQILTMQKGKLSWKKQHQEPTEKNITTESSNN
jgi:hypothetical protein